MKSNWLKAILFTMLLYASIGSVLFVAISLNREILMWVFLCVVLTGTVISCKKTLDKKKE